MAYDPALAGDDALSRWITGRYSTNVDEDWRQVEANLQQAYRALS